MAIERNPNDPYGAAEPVINDTARRRAEQIDYELQVDPELAEGPASGGRIALFAIALVAILGVVFYGLNSSSTAPNATPTAQTAPAPPSNTAQAPRPPAGQTTGSAMTPSQPAQPPAANNPAPASPQNSGSPPSNNQ